LTTTIGGRSVVIDLEERSAAMTEGRPQAGRIRRWLDKRRERRRRGAEIAQRAKDAHRGNLGGASRHGNVHSGGDPGPFGGA
jgi:hypothetical protein